MNTVIGRFRTINPDIQHRQKSAITEAMHAVDAANTYLSQQEPWKLGRADPARMETVLHVAAQAVDDCKTLLAPFLPHTAQRIHEQLGRQGRFTDRPDVGEVDDLDDGGGYPVLMLAGDRGTGRWESTPIVPGTPITAPTPIFTKLDPSVVDRELFRLKARD